MQSFAEAFLCAGDGALDPIHDEDPVMNGALRISVRSRRLLNWADEERMTEIKHHHHPDEGPHAPSDHDNSIPYWKRAHRDWRMWTAAFFVLAALAIYILTVDLSPVPRVHAPSVTVGK